MRRERATAFRPSKLRRRELRAQHEEQTHERDDGRVHEHKYEFAQNL
jgi:hypothetical protein